MSRLPNLKGNDVTEVRTSQASKTAARGFNDLAELNAAIDKLTAEREAVAAEKRELMDQMAALKAEVRGGRVDPARYRWICAEQARVGPRLRALDDRLAAIRDERIPLMDIRRELTGDNTKDMLYRKVCAVQQEVCEVKRLLEEVLRRLPAGGKGR